MCISIGLYAGVQRLKQYQGVERRSSLKIEAILSGRQDLQHRVASELQYVLAMAEGQQVLVCASEHDLLLKDDSLSVTGL